MRVLEHRRHSHREPSSVHLSRDGVALAHRLAATIGRFDRVVTSPKPRAVESAEALGFAVDATLPELGKMPDDAGIPLDQLNPRSFADYVRGTRRSATMAAYARSQAALMRRELEQVPEEGRLLLVSHGGVIEFGAAAARPVDARSFGPPLGHLEGVRLYLDAGEWVRGEVLRVAP